MKPTKFICLILALVMVSSLFLAGCKDKTDPKTVPGGAEVPKETVEELGLPPRDLGGHEFTFLVTSNSRAHLDTNEVFAEELTGDKVNDAVFRRNSKLEQDYNCKILEERVENTVTAIKDSLLADEYIHDFIYANHAAMVSFAASGLLVDVNMTDSIDLERSWWDQELRAGLNILGKQFFLLGDCGTMDERSTWIMLFSKDLLEKNRLELPYDLALNGEWTVAKMVEYVNECAEDVDGDGVMTPGTDIFGYVGEGFNDWAHVAGCEGRLSRYSSSGDIDIPFVLNERVQNAWAELKPLLATSNRLVSDSSSHLKNNRAAFYAVNAGVLMNMGEVTMNFGIIPMPKLNAEQEKYWAVCSRGLLRGYMIPATTIHAPDAEDNGFKDGQEQAAYFIDAFCFHSRDTLKVAFYDQVIKRQMVPDEVSGKMLDLALTNKLHDPVALYGWGSLFQIFRDACSGGTGNSGNWIIGNDANYDTVNSLYEQRVNSARKAMTTFKNNIEVEAG